MKFGKSRDEQKYNPNDQNYDFNENENNFQNNNLINNDTNIEMNDIQNHNTYSQRVKEDVSPEDSNRLKEQERINYLIFKGFLGKVYGIISIQLLISLIFIFFFQRDSIKSYFLKHEGFTTFMNIISIILFFGTLILVSIKEDLCKVAPYTVFHQI